MFRRRKLRWPKWWNGRHARLRGVWRKPCGFKSRLRHQTQQSCDGCRTHQQLIADAGTRHTSLPSLLIFSGKLDPAHQAIHAHTRRPNTDLKYRHPDASRHPDKRPYRTRAQLHCRISIISTCLIELDVIMPLLWAYSPERDQDTRRHMNTSRTRHHKKIRPHVVRVS